MEIYRNQIFLYYPQSRTQVKSLEQIKDKEIDEKYLEEEIIPILNIKDPYDKEITKKIRSEIDWPKTSNTYYSLFNNNISISKSFETKDYKEKYIPFLITTKIEKYLKELKFNYIKPFIYHIFNSYLHNTSISILNKKDFDEDIQYLFYKFFDGQFLVFEKLNKKTQKNINTYKVHFVKTFKDLVINFNKFSDISIHYLIMMSICEKLFYIEQEKSFVFNYFRNISYNIKVKFKKSLYNYDQDVQYFPVNIPLSKTEKIYYELFYSDFKTWKEMKNFLWTYIEKNYSDDVKMIIKNYLLPQYTTSNIISNNIYQITSDYIWDTPNENIDPSTIYNYMKLLILKDLNLGFIIDKELTTSADKFIKLVSEILLIWIKKNDFKKLNKMFKMLNQKFFKFNHCVSDFISKFFRLIILIDENIQKQIIVNKNIDMYIEEWIQMYMFSKLFNIFDFSNFSDNLFTTIIKNQYFYTYDILLNFLLKLTIEYRTMLFYQLNSFANKLKYLENIDVKNFFKLTEHSEHLIPLDINYKGLDVEKIIENLIIPYKNKDVLYKIKTIDFEKKDKKNKETIDLIINNFIKYFKIHNKLDTSLTISNISIILKYLFNKLIEITEKQNRGTNEDIIDKINNIINSLEKISNNIINTNDKYEIKFKICKTLFTNFYMPTTKHLFSNNLLDKIKTSKFRFRSTIISIIKEIKKRDSNLAPQFLNEIKDMLFNMQEKEYYLTIKKEIISNEK